MGFNPFTGGGGTSSEDKVARAEIAAIKDGETLDSFSDVETALADKANITDIPTVPITTIQKNGTDIAPVSGTVNITVPTTAVDVSALPDTTKYASTLSLTINSQTFVITGQLKDQNGNNLGEIQTIDLPLESVVVDGSYNSQTKKVVLTLQNGNTIEFSVADLVAGLQSELTATNKLNPAYINYDNTHAAVTESDKTTWSGKQDALAFDGTYSASTNKAATVSTVTNAVNALDVTGDASVSASKTISAWSETDGKVSISTQDIAITGTQTTLTGYAKSGTAGQAVVATDNVNQAIGKLETTVDDNKNNISLNTQYSGGRNIGNFAYYGLNPDQSIAAGTITHTESNGVFTFTGAADSSKDYACYLLKKQLIKAGNYVVSGISGGSTSTYWLRIGAGISDTFKMNVTDSGTILTLDSDTKITVQLVVKAGVSLSNKVFSPMIITATDWANSHDFQQYGESNAQLSAIVQADTDNMTEFKFAKLDDLSSSVHFKYGFLIGGGGSSKPNKVMLWHIFVNTSNSVYFTKIIGDDTMTLTGSIADGVLTISSSATIYGGLRLIWLG